MVIKISKLALLATFLMALTSCGTRNTTTDVKKYVFSIDSESALIKAKIIDLLDFFNDNVGREVLEYSDNQSSVNSTIVVQRGLQAHSKKGTTVGLGQNLISTKIKRGFNFPNNTIKTVKKFTMRLQFDEAYFQKRILNNTEKSEQELRVLVSHEVGHGAEENHNNQDPTDIMYHTINGVKNFNPFFERMRLYFADSRQDI